MIEVKPVVEMFLKPLAIAKEERDKNYKKMGAGPLNAHSHVISYLLLTVQRFILMHVLPKL